jgi:hypothetical protein
MAEIELTEKQDDAFELLTNLEDVDLCYGGAKGGGKSFLGCVWVFHWCNWLIKYWGLKPTKYPLLAGFMGRKIGADFRDTTLETFKRVIPHDFYKVREQAREIIIRDCIKIEYGGLDNVDAINKFNSAELAFIFIDQAEETEQRDVSVLEGARRLTYNGKRPPYKTLYTANPAECWLKHAYVDGNREQSSYIPALPTDNPHLPAGYVEHLKKTFGYDKKLLKAYLEGNWDLSGRDRTMIPSGLINDLKEVKYKPVDKRLAISCDPSLGGDECVIMRWDSFEVKEMYIKHTQNSMEIAGDLILLARRNGIPCSHIGIDTSDKLGFAIADRIQEVSGESPVRINSAEKAGDDKMYYNKRAEMWDIARQKIEKKEIPYIKDSLTRIQLSAVRFEDVQSSRGRLKLELKEKTKKRISSSPDRGDCFIYGVYTVSITKPLAPSDGYRPTDTERYVAPEPESSGIRGGY